MDEVFIHLRQALAMPAALFPFRRPGEPVPLPVLQNAAQRFQVDAGLIEAILADEASRLDLADYLQQGVAWALIRLPRRGAQALAHTVQRLTGRDLAQHSLGPAQMKPLTLQALGKAQLIDVPPALQDQIRLLLTPTSAVLCVAARLRQIINHWQAGGTDLSERPEILGTLYSIGLQGKAGVHAEPVASSRGLQIARLSRQLARRSGPLTRSPLGQRPLATAEAGIL